MVESLARGRRGDHLSCGPRARRESARRARSPLLDDEEKTRWRRFLAVAPRRQFALCRAALRVTLAERLGCSNRRLSFGYGEHGKPFARVDGRRAPVGFNASHSGQHGLIAVAGARLARRRCGGAHPSARSRRYRQHGLRPDGTALTGVRRRIAEGASLFPALEHEGGAHQGPGLRIFPESIRLRSARADAARRPVERNSIPARAVEQLVSHRPGRTSVRRRVRLQGSAFLSLPSRRRRSRSTIEAGAIPPEPLGSSGCRSGRTAVGEHQGACRQGRT